MRLYKPLIVTLIILCPLKCSRDYKLFQSPDNLYSLSYPISWSCEKSDKVLSFFYNKDGIGALMVSGVFEKNNNSFNIKKEMKEHPSSKAVKFKNLSGIFFEEKDKYDINFNWLLGKSNTRLHCTYTFSAKEKGTPRFYEELKAVHQMLDSLNIHRN